MNARHPLQCRCGTLRGHVEAGPMALRGVCYCRDCQAYAHYLGQAHRVLDERGGTEIVATLPAQVRFTQGFDVLTCMSLAPGGLLRWYAACCNTPVGNTSRHASTPYVGLVQACLSSRGAPPLRRSFGEVAVVLNAASAPLPVHSHPLRNVVGMVRLLKAMAVARLKGLQRLTPFFDDAGQPVREPQVLSEGERRGADALLS